jgi:hypothetical protein
MAPRTATTPQSGSSGYSDATAGQSSNPRNTTYEVQVFRDKRWRIDSMFDDKALALVEAKRMTESGRFIGVRVLAETFDERSGNATTTTVYRGGRIEEAGQVAREDSAQMRREIGTLKGSTQGRAPAQSGTKDSDGATISPIVGAIIAAAVFALGVAALIVFRSVLR